MNSVHKEIEHLEKELQDERERLAETNKLIKRKERERALQTLEEKWRTGKPLQEEGGACAAESRLTWAQMCSSNSKIKLDDAILEERTRKIQNIKRIEAQLRELNKRIFSKLIDDCKKKQHKELKEAYDYALRILNDTTTPEDEQREREKERKKQQEQDLLKEGSWSESERLAGLDERKESCLSDEAKRGVLQTERRDIAHRAQGDDINELFEELETDGSKLCVRISSIPEKAGKSTDEFVLEISELLGAGIQHDDIYESYRNDNNDIIVRFTNLRAKNKFLKGKAVLKDLNCKYYINDYLTPNTSVIAFACRQLKRNASSIVQATWIYRGNVFVATRKNGKPIKISSLDELGQFGYRPK